ncbi:MAG: Mur ligase family protein [Planctomycetota bacterium]
MEKDLRDLAGARVTVMGLGRFGGGLGVTRWLAKQGADVLLTDLASEHDLADPLAELQHLIDDGRITLRLGEHNVSDFTSCDLVIANPAVPKPWDNRFLRSAQAAGVPITTEIELLVTNLPQAARTIGVTGTAGKSTTSAMIHHALEQVANTPVHLGGNIGGSLLDSLGDVSDTHVVVLELSSAMLYWLRDSPWSPDVAVLTNIASNHLDWHGSVQHYVESKQRIAGHATRTLVLGPDAQPWATGADTKRVSVEDIESLPRLRTPGAHNRINGATALLAALELHDDRDRLAHAIAMFPGLPHRLRFIGAWPNGVRAFDDSKCTTPEAAALAIEAIRETTAGTIHLIAGGHDKGVDLSPMTHAAKQHEATVYAIGATATAIANLVGEACVEAGTLDLALAAIADRLQPGDAVLLSPGCASWDQFSNYEERGARFEACLNRLLGARTQRARTQKEYE